MVENRKYRMGKNTGWGKITDEQKYRMSEFFEKKYQQTQTSYYFESCNINVPHPSRLINMVSSSRYGLCHIHGRLCVFFISVCSAEKHSSYEKRQSGRTSDNSTSLICNRGPDPDYKSRFSSGFVACLYGSNLAANQIWYFYVISPLFCSIQIYQH